MKKNGRRERKVVIIEQNINATKEIKYYVEKQMREA